MSLIDPLCRPMLAAKYDKDAVQGYLDIDGAIFAQPKYDGMRVLVNNKLAISRSGKPFTNLALKAFLADHGDVLDGLDCEAVAGRGYSAESFRESMSGVRARAGQTELALYTFDIWNLDVPYRQRADLLRNLMSILSHRASNRAECLGTVDMVRFEKPGVYDIRLYNTPTYRLESLRAIEDMHAQFLEQGYEGTMLRRKNARYKHGRATVRQGALVKIKEYVDAEAVIIGVEPRYHNENAATTTSWGLTERSSHREGLREMPILGALHVRLYKHPGIEFKIGVFKGLTLEQKEQLWADRKKLIGKIVRFAAMGYEGGYGLPRCPVFLDFRDPIDMGE